MIDRMKNANELISIAMATYNGENYLAEQLDSILNQTHTNIEIVIVDDCSKDTTIEIIKFYKQKYPCIKLYHNEKNNGVVRSFEKAINLCSGDYIALSDQDDVWFPYKLEELLNNIGNNLLIHSDAILVDEKMNVITKSHFDCVKERSKLTYVDYLISNNVTGCTMMFSRKLAELAMPIPNEFYIHDHYLAIVASFYGTIKLLDEPLVYYRQHGLNSIGAARPDFNQFLIGCKAKADSLKSLLSMTQFKNNWQIELLSDYRLAFYNHNWKSKYSIYRLLRLRHGIKLIAYYLILNLPPLSISEKIYNKIHKIY